MSPSVSSPQLRHTKSNRAISRIDRTDPLALALQPPANEAPADKYARLHQEKLAKQRSDEIDKFLKQHQEDRATHGLASSPSTSVDGANFKKGRVYKMVLLGQAGAGKTTVLKQMRLLYDPPAHERERRGWTKIVLLNLTSSVRVLLETLSLYHDQRLERKSSEHSRLESSTSASTSASASASSPKHVDTESQPNDATRLELAKQLGTTKKINTSSLPWLTHIPSVVQLERALRTELGAFGEEAVLSASSDEAAITNQKVRTRLDAQGSSSIRGEKSPLVLRPGWQERLFTYARRSLSLTQNGRAAAARRETDGGDSQCESEKDNSETLKLLRAIRPEVLALWNDDAGCRALRKRGLFLDGQSDAATSYFLDNYSRITDAAYRPTDEDILYSRVRTLGVTEDVFRVDRSLIYRIYDVGGSRSQRAAWAPFLDDIESIIFLAPLSAFDQPLVEDCSTNRLADTFTLFNQIVTNPLLEHATMILFLNKIDLLEKKLRQGVQLHKYWPEYVGDNDFEAVWRWFRAKFRDALRRAEDEVNLDQTSRRRLYVHTTVATSTVQIRAILMSVKDSILRENLKLTGLVG